MTRRNVAANPAAAENDVIVIDDRSLSGCYGTLRIMQSDMGTIIVEWRDRRTRPGMVISDLHGRFKSVVVAAGGVRGCSIDRQAAAGGVRGYSVPVHTIDLKLLTDQIVGIANDHAIRCRVQIDNITRTWRTTRQPFALADRKHLDAVMFTEEIPGDVINLTTVKFIFTQMRTQKCLVIIAGNESNFLAVNLVRDFQA